MSQNVIETEKNGSYLHVIATKLEELMSAKAHATQDSPTHYASLKWVVAFGDSFFDAHMDWVKPHDPVFGAGGSLRQHEEPSGQSRWTKSTLGGPVRSTKGALFSHILPDRGRKGTGGTCRLSTSRGEL